MREDEKQRKSALVALLDAIRACFSFGSRMLDFLSRLMGRVLPATHPAEHLPKSGRDQDQSLETESEMLHRESLGSVLVVCYFLLAMAGGVGFLIAYWSGGDNTQWLGGTLALFLGALGTMLVVWARMLMVQKRAVEPRHAVRSTPAARKAAEKTFCDGVHDVRRRRLLTWMALSSAGLFGTMVLSLFRSLGMSPDKTLYSRIWKGGQRLVTADGKPVSLETLKTGSIVTVFPEDQVGEVRAQTSLIRVKEDLLEMPSERAGWTPGGYVAYSRVCTHAGCPVGEYETEQAVLLCPCHQSTFDVLRAAKPIGGPAARPLPQLPLYADADGTLRAGGGFTAPPGPSFWSVFS